MLGKELKGLKVSGFSTVFNGIQFYVCVDDRGRNVIKSEKELAALETEIEAERLAEEEVEKKTKPKRFGGKGGK